MLFRLASATKRRFADQSSAGGQRWVSQWEIAVEPEMGSERHVVADDEASAMR
jgi:hypothetical protein